MTLDLGTILGIIAGVFLFVLSWLFKSEKEQRQEAEKQRDNAEQNLKIMTEYSKAIDSIIREQQRKDNAINTSDVSRDDSLGVWDNEVRDSTTDVQSSSETSTTGSKTE